jgi:prepilin-type N-terminal cleavage/methylation domain-containing protein
MKSFLTNRPARRNAAFTLVEMLVAVAIGTAVSVALMGLYVSGFFNFTSMANYQNLNENSYRTMDNLSRVIRNSNKLLSYVAGTSLTLSNNTAGRIDVITYDSAAQTLSLTTHGSASTNVTTTTYLTQCTAFNFQLYTQAPNTNSFSTNIVFSAATTAASVKVINMSWKCSRTLLGAQYNSESVQTAQIVMRNKTSQ